MRKWIGILAIYLIGVLFLLLMAYNVKTYEKWQNKTQNNSVEQLY